MIDLILGLQNLLLLGADVGDHLVERARKIADVAVDGTHRHHDVEIARGNAVGGADQLPDRPNDTVGNRDCRPDRRQQHDQRKADVENAEGDLREGAARL